MLKTIIDFIEEEYKAIIATIIFLLLILIVSMVMSLISQGFCNIEKNMDLDLEENSSCKKWKCLKILLMF